jgi:2-(1,2-epoxy-1,2-dihydrophenyl)acetyl-CoA isomerase
MLMLGEKVAGADAATWGLVHRSVAAAELESASHHLVERLVSAPTVAVGLTKLLLHRGLTSDIDRHLADEAWAMDVSSRSEDFKEYGRASREKREPRYTGQ